mmetsp:Transcript_20086/g.29806  ORF Transcript_20086/g.29806 Transcript_20086/m.29806 type:complete len:222 (-) Transcript_20086:56-721(-)
MVASLLIAFVPHIHCNDPILLDLQNHRSQKLVPSRTTRLHLSITTSADEELLPSIREAIQEESEEENAEQLWEEATDTVATITGLDKKQSEIALAKAFGWRAWVKVTSKIARRFMKTSLPSVIELNKALDWSMKTGPLSLSQEQIQIAIGNNPEVYLIDPATTYKTALSVAPEPYSDPEQFNDLAILDPTVLACTFNCMDKGCSSECGNCWVSYDLKTKSS